MSSFLSVSGMVFAAPVTLSLGDDPGENVIEITATVNGSLMDTQMTTYSGEIIAEVEVTSEEVTEFEMSGGSITASDVTFLFEVPMLFSQMSGFESLKATPVSPNGVEVLATPGKFSAVDHYFLFNEGCVTLEGNLVNSKSLVMDDPFIAAGTSTGEITLASPQAVISPLNREVIGTEYEVSFQLPLNATTSDSDGTFTLTRETSGTVTARGTMIDYVHPFYEWAAANASEAGAALAFEADTDADGMPDGVAWALGFAAGDQSKSLSLSYDEAEKMLTIILPSATRAVVTVEKSETLDPRDWAPVSGMAPLPVASVDPVKIPTAGVTKAFYRFSATLE